MRRQLAIFALVALAACGGNVDLGGQPPGGGNNDGDDDGDPPAGGTPDAAPPQQPPPTTDLEFCVAETNRYRAMIGKPPLEHSPVLEDFATEGAMADTLSGEAHGHFGDQDPLVAFAENECPSFLGWTVEGNVHDTIAKCLLAFFKEGEGGGHYENMMGDYKGCGCGVYLSGDNQITITQDFN